MYRQRGIFILMMSHDASISETWDTFSPSTGNNIAQTALSNVLMPAPKPIEHQGMRIRTGTDTGPQEACI